MTVLDTPNDDTVICKTCGRVPSWMVGGNTREPVYVDDCSKCREKDVEIEGRLDWEGWVRK